MVAVNKQRERSIQRIAFVVVATPFIGAAVAVALLWGRAVDATSLVLLVVMYSLTIAGIGVGYHRYFSHKAFGTTPAVGAVLAILGSMAAQGPVLFWAATHRRHHAYSDRPGDPHSPHLHGTDLRGFLKGFWHAHTGWLFFHEVTDWGRYAPELLRDRWLLRINQLYFVWIALGLVIPAVVGGIVTASWTGAAAGFLWGGLVRTFLVHHTTWAVNSITHIIGTRPYRSRDLSRNNVVIALLAFGEGWHNNHHAFPSSARHGLEWWQLDINAIIIRTLERLGWAWDLKVPSARALADARRSA